MDQRDNSSFNCFIKTDRPNRLMKMLIALSFLSCDHTPEIIHSKKISLLRCDLLYWKKLQSFLSSLINKLARLDRLLYPSQLSPVHSATRLLEGTILRLHRLHLYSCVDQSILYITKRRMFQDQQHHSLVFLIRQFNLKCNASVM